MGGAEEEACEGGFEGDVTVVFVVAGFAGERAEEATNGLEGDTADLEDEDVAGVVEAVDGFVEEGAALARADAAEADALDAEDAEEEEEGGFADGEVVFAAVVLEDAVVVGRLEDILARLVPAERGVLACVLSLCKGRRLGVGGESWK